MPSSAHGARRCGTRRLGAATVLAAAVLAAAPMLAAAPAVAVPAAPAPAAITPFIYNGHAVPWTEHSEVARLSVTEGASRFRCGGTFLSGQWVLTAAHCVTTQADAAATTDTAGLTSVPGTPVAGRDVEVHFSPGGADDIARGDYVVVHPRFRTVYHGEALQYLHHDVALVHLASPVDSVAHTTIAPDAQATAGGGLTAYGWGDTDPGADTALSDTLLVTPQPLTLLDTAYPECDPDAGATAEEPTVRCVSSGPGGTTGSGVGDSGGPWFVTGADGAVRQAAVTSFGRAQGIPTDSAPGMVAYLPELSGWIDSVLADPPGPGSDPDGNDAGGNNASPGPLGSLASLSAS